MPKIEPQFQNKAAARKYYLDHPDQIYIDPEKVEQRAKSNMIEQLRSEINDFEARIFETHQQAIYERNNLIKTIQEDPYFKCSTDDHQEARE